MRVVLKSQKPSCYTNTNMIFEISTPNDIEYNNNIPAKFYEVEKMRRDKQQKRVLYKFHKIEYVITKV